MLKAIFKGFFSQIQQQRERWIFWLPVPMGCGIALYFSLKSEPYIWVGTLFTLLFLPCVFLSARKLLFIPVLSLFLCALGFSAAQWRTAVIDAPVLARETRPLLLQGRVVELDPLPGADRVILDQLSIIEGRKPDVLPEKIRVRLKKRTDTDLPRAGDKIELRAVLLPLSPPVAPGAFDFQRHAFFKGIGATGYAVSDIKILESSADQGGFFFEHLRHNIRERIEAAIPDHDTAAITTALLIGESNNISEETWEVIRASGIAHLISISGFHITLVTGFVFFLTRALLAAVPWVALRWPVKKISAAVSIFAAVFYLALIGAPVPAQRAVIMAAVVMLAVMLDRDPFTQRLTAFAALVIFLIEPETLTGPSFQLSFAAVIALIAAFEWARPIISRKGEGFLPFYMRWPRAFAVAFIASIATTLVASLATAPFALYHFSRMPLLSGVAANAIAIPLSSFITMPFGLLGCLLMPLGLEQWPLTITGKSVEWIMAVAQEVTTWPHATWTMKSWPLSALVFVSLGGLWICFWRGWINVFIFGAA